MKKLCSVITVLAGGICLIPCQLLAGPVTWAFQVEAKEIVDFDNLLQGAVGVGDSLNGFLTFDANTKSVPPESGIYSDALTDIFVQSEAISFAGPSGPLNNITIIDGTIGAFDNFGLVIAVTSFNLPMVFSISLRDSTGAVFSTNELPTSLPSLEWVDLDESGFALSQSSERFAIYGEVRNIHVVPEPHMVILLGAGMIVLLANNKLKNAQNTRVGALGLIVFGIRCFGFSEVHAADCNNNGIEDNQEIGPCSAIDIVFL